MHVWVCVRCNTRVSSFALNQTDLPRKLGLSEASSSYASTASQAIVIHAGTVAWRITSRLPGSTVVRVLEHAIDLTLRLVPRGLSRPLGFWQLLQPSRVDPLPFDSLLLIIDYSGRGVSSRTLATLARSVTRRTFARLFRNPFGSSREGRVDDHSGALRPRTDLAEILV